MANNKNGYGVVIGFLLQAGFFTFLGGLIMFYMERDKDFDLEEKKFQYGLIKEGLRIDDQMKRNQELSLYYDLNLLDSAVIGLNLDSLSYKLTYIRGKADGGNSRSIVNAIKEFYGFKGKAPISLEELNKHFNISNALKHFRDNVQFKATGPKEFILQFPGRDGILFTNDDKRFTYNDLKLE